MAVMSYLFAAGVAILLGIIARVIAEWIGDKKYVVVVGVVAALVLGTCFIIGGHAETYAVKTEVVSVDGGVVSVRLNDDIFSFYGNWFVQGDKIVIKVYDRDTSSIYDDRIITVERRMRRVHRHLPF